MQMRDVRAMTDDELGTELDDSHRELMNLRFRGATMQLPNVNEIKKIRKRVAQIRTVMRERELARASR
jgi:large subunit ribosomal protein L29